MVDLSGKIPQTRGITYSPKYGKWKPSNLYIEHDKKFDILIVYCISEDGKIIERIYIFPKEEIKAIGSISIIKNPLKGIQWYEAYRVDDEEIKKVNEIWILAKE